MRSTAPIVVQVLGMLVLVWGFTAWREGNPLEITTGHVATAAGCLLAMVAITRFSQPVLRLVIHRPFLVWLAFMAVTAGFMIAFLVLDGVV